VSSGLLAIYLRDHHAAGSAGARLAARAAKSVTPGVAGREELPRIAGEIQADLETLTMIMRSQGVSPSAVKDNIAVALQGLGRLKLNGRIARRSPLSDVVELETLLVGITGKVALWRTLSRVVAGSAVDFDALVGRAQTQIEAVVRCRDSAASRSFGGSAG